MLLQMEHAAMLQYFGKYVNFIFYNFFLQNWHFLE